MAGSLNRATLIGNLGADPEVRTTREGKPVATFSLATSESWRDKATSEKRERTEWHRIVIFSEGLVKIAEQYLRKGMNVLVEGQIRTRKWQAQDGQDRYSTEIVLQGIDARITMLGSSGGGRAPAPDGEADYGQQAAAPSDGFIDDDIPF